jgi:hypothetical protein
MECEDVFCKVKVELGVLSIPPLTVFKTIYGMGVVRVIKAYSGGGGVAVEVETTLVHTAYLCPLESSSIMIY